MRACFVLLVLSTAISAPAQAAADPPPTTSDVEAQAFLHFQRGVELFEESDFDGAAVELRRAYELVANFRILYNLGQVAAERHDYAAALAHFARYLAEGGTRFPRRGGKSSNKSSAG